MPISKPKRLPSTTQLEKARRCVVYQFSPTKSQVWDPMVDSFHWVENGQCDCPGFAYHDYCSHVCAVELKAQRNLGLTYEQAVEELFDL